MTHLRLCVEKGVDRCYRTQLLVSVMEKLGLKLVVETVNGKKILDKFLPVLVVQSKVFKACEFLKVVLAILLGKKEREDLGNHRVESYLFNIVDNIGELNVRTLLLEILSFTCLRYQRVKF